MAPKLMDVANCFAKEDKVIKITALLILSVYLYVTYFVSIFSGLAVLTSYFLGLVASSLFIRYQPVIISVVENCRNSKQSPQSGSNVCHICHGANCARNLAKGSSKPWAGLRLTRKLNEAVEHFFNTILSQFIESWYHEFTGDRRFLHQLRAAIRYASATAANKILHLQLGRIITDKLTPCAIRHIDDYLCMQQIAKLKNIGIEQVAISHLGRRLHFAATNRKNEVEYLRQISAMILPKLVPDDFSNCGNFSVFLRELFTVWVLLPLMDVIVDPNIINALVILTTTYKSRDRIRLYQTVATVEFLENFQNRSDDVRSPFALKLQTVLKNRELLYEFMQFMKKNDSVHYLQFCLDQEEITNKLLTDLKGDEVSKLSTETNTFVEMYFDPTSPYFVNCSLKYIDEIRRILDVGDVLALRKTNALFAANEEIYAMLESEYLPHFFHSKEFYGFICKSRDTGTSKSSQRLPGSPSVARNKRLNEVSSGGHGATSKITNKIKSVLQTKTIIDGAIYVSDDPQMPVGSEGPSYAEEISLDMNLSRNMSTWRITIPTVSQEYGTKHLYHITVTENGRDWTIKRKDQDFYTLKGKLIEFHGETDICDIPLPSRRSGVHHEMRKSHYESFLRGLQQKSFLRGSDLLHTFLTTQQDFTLLTAQVPLVDLENIYQSVSYKLRKEKGQHLNSFMGTFMNSIERTKHNKFEVTETSLAIDVSANMSSVNTHHHQPKTLHNPIFNDNFGIEYNKDAELSECSINPVGFTESLFYLFKHVFKLHETCLRLFAAFASVIQPIFESSSQRYIEHKIRTALNQDNLTYLITLLEDVIFTKQIQPSAEELQQRKRRAFKELNNLLSERAARILGTDVRTGCGSLLEVLQNPHLNKHLIYNLFDLIIVEMFPELDRLSDD